jgi:hypothetical protein
MDWRKQEAKIAFRAKLDPGCSNGVLQHAFDDCSDNASPQASAGMAQSSSTAYMAQVPNRFGDFWRGRAGLPFVVP